jgi:alpha-tubulin suppressor-like RCC1 family protein
VRGIAAGGDDTCALMTTGGVRCWGANWDGQVGDGTKEDRLLPPTADILSGVQAIAPGGGTTCALMTTGGVRCWGNQLTENGYSTARPTPPGTDMLSGVKAIAMSGHTCVLMTTGGVRCWGTNWDGQLGNGTRTASPTWTPPTTTDVLDGVQAIATAEFHTCALMTTGGVRCWGRGDVGQLGDGTGTNLWTPPSSDILSGVQAIAASGQNTCALMTTGGVQCWGFRFLNGSSSIEMTPTPVQGLCQ